MVSNFFQAVLRSKVSYVIYGLTFTQAWAFQKCISADLVLHQSKVEADVKFMWSLKNGQQSPMNLQNQKCLKTFLKTITAKTSNVTDESKFITQAKAFHECLF